MTRRWPLITTIAVLAGALAFVVVHLVRDQDAGKGADGAEPATSSPESRTDPLRGLGWWPLHRSGTARAGEHDATVSGGARWTEGPQGGALRLDGSTGQADTNLRLDTAGQDYSVAARVRASSQNMTGIHTAVSEDGDRTSTFYLQFSGPDGNFAFSFLGARTVAETAEKPQPDHWYHLTGTYSQKDHRMRIYVDGRLAGTREASNGVEPTGTVVIGRGKFNGKAADHWNGDIADVHVFGRELTSREVSSLSSNEPG
ncbi:MULTISPECIES: LamG domain-containing protein [unclassified Streptomyces]|uniref:LamG domain-containing protein n=1 Tax=unclassified Streptomyces TaxID=2593676 RepID=UPI000DBA732A|nr:MULTISPECIES: LamG domain-containing protein [unclassified Streptomyces]MYT73847.1 LamG domain-containing protein [Streptomyces sp. SID8367]RAJ89260.1 concanavalin A-like lectin/glucanase superfamily protein [Streptomyces sp. PsTaAH-137]